MRPQGVFYFIRNESGVFAKESQTRQQETWLTLSLVRPTGTILRDSPEACARVGSDLTSWLEQGIRDGRILRKSGTSRHRRGPMVGMARA